MPVFSVIVWPFIVFAVFWAITWSSVKRTVEGQTFSERFSYWNLRFNRGYTDICASKAPCLQCPLGTKVFDPAVFRLFD